MKVTIVQSKVYKSKDKNLETIQNQLNHVLDTDLIVFPEMFISPFDNEFLYRNSVSEKDSFFKIMKELALKKNAYIVAGSVPEKAWDNYYNTSYIFNNKGEVINKYRKIHLFEVTYPNGKTYKESDKIEAGKELVTFQINQETIGVMICFDIRFPLLAKQLQEKGAKLLVIPAAFNQYTGPLHWELTFRARAVDNQLFTLGVSPSSLSEGKYEYYGNSILVNPLGKVLYKASEEDIIIKTIDINLNEVSEIRETLPILKNEVKVDDLI